MARRPCKCRQCGANLTTDVAVKEMIAGRPAYFCGDEHRELYMSKLRAEQEQKAKEEALRNKFYGLYCGILGVNGITNTALWKEKQDLNQVFEDEVIIAYLEENKVKLTQMVSRLGGGEYGKIRYVGVVLRNNLADFKAKVAPRTTAKQNDLPKVSSEEHYTPKYKATQRKALLDFEEEYDE